MEEFSGLSQNERKLMKQTIVDFNRKTNQISVENFEEYYERMNTLKSSVNDHVEVY